jgi:hypothetical protein
VAKAAVRRIAIPRAIVVFFAGDVLRSRVRRLLGRIDNQAYFDDRIGTIPNCVDIGSVETQRRLTEAITLVILGKGTIRAIMLGRVARGSSQGKSPHEH